MSSFLVRLEKLNIGFSSSFPILQNINFSVAEGEIIAITGRNGSGKTTLIRTIAGLLQPLNGKINRSNNLSISLVPQIKKMNLSYPISVEEILSLPEETGFFFPFKKYKFSSNELNILEQFGITDYKNKLLRECSGGQIQKVLLARSLIGNSNLLILDEPLDALDESSKTLFMNLVRERMKKNELSILLITHHLEENWMQNFTKCISLIDGKMEESEHGKCHTIH